MALCPKCGTENLSTSKFCHECGASLVPVSSVCPKCAAENPSTGKFCQQCGASLAPSPPPQSETGQKQFSEPRSDAVTNENEKSHLKRMSTGSTAVGIGLAVIAVIFFSFFAMGDGSAVLNNRVGGTRAPVTTSKTSAPTTTTTSASTTTTGKTLNEILGLSASIGSIKYDMLVSGTGIPAMTTKMWIKKNKMRMEITQQGMNTVTLIDSDAKTMIAYMPAQNLAMKMPFDQNQVPASPADQAKTITSSNARVTSTETFDGKVCTVVEYTSGQQYYKAWVWQDKGIAIRLEATISGTGKIISEYKNIDFSDIPDSMFQLPAGVKIM